MLATFMSVVAIIATIASLRYNVAIPIVRYERSSCLVDVIYFIFIFHKYYFINVSISKWRRTY